MGGGGRDAVASSGSEGAKDASPGLVGRVRRQTRCAPAGGREANRILRAGGLDKEPSDQRFKPIVNGKDFTGWAGPVASRSCILWRIGRGRREHRGPR